jgi:3-methylcrotonyl-CoA carboxylase alpha subunit
MIAKVIAYGPDREAARERLAACLSDSVIWPLRTNAGFLVKALEHPAFVAADVDTGLIGREGDRLMPPERPSEAALEDAAAALSFGGGPGGFRLNAPARREASFLLDGEAVSVSFDPGRGGKADDAVLIAEGGQVWRLSQWRVDGMAAGGASDGLVLSPMPGRIISVAVAQGDRVVKGQRLLTLEAMKMEHGLAAPFDGVVAELHAAEGGQVSEGALLARIDKGEA